MGDPINAGEKSLWVFSLAHMVITWTNLFTVNVVLSSCKVRPIATYLSSMATYTHMDTHMDQSIFKSGRGGKFFLCLTFLCTSLILVGLSAFLYSRQLETESDGKIVNL